MEHRDMQDHSPLPQAVRLEMLVGRLSELLAPADELIAGLRLKSNASAVTRGQIDHLVGMTGLMWEELRKLREQVAQVKAGA
jgi:hypothetical protein